MIGTLLNGRFRLEERLGAGGMSTVYRAFDETLERWVAIKILHSEISSDAAQLERFGREARAVARLSSPHVVTVIDAGEDDGHPYIVFECVEGETLKDRIRRLGRLPIPDAVAYAIEIGRGLSSAHAERLVHRDVKPQNVLIGPDGRAKVTDFGIARSLEAQSLTMTGRVLGTTDYVSPEQALGEAVDEQSDVYSLGICLYEMLIGEVPFTAETQVGVAMQHVRDPTPDVQRLRPEVSSALAAVVERATAKERRNRYATAADMVRDLERALAVEAARAGETSGEATTVLRTLPSATSEIAPQRLRRPWRWLASVLAVAAAVAATVAFLATRAHEGTTGAAPPPRVPGLVPVKLGGAKDYDPPPGDGSEHPEAAAQAIDDNRGTYWRTQNYFYPGGGLGDKRGVGLYVDAETPVAARRLSIVTAFPGWEGEVYGANRAPRSIRGWHRVAGRTRMAAVEDIPLDTRGRRYRYYLVWIVKLPGAGKQAAISELTLLQQGPQNR